MLAVERTAGAIGGKLTVTATTDRAVGGRLLDPPLSVQLTADRTVSLVDELIDAHGNLTGLH